MIHAQPKRGIGHYFLLLLAGFFTFEFIIFFTTALSRARLEEEGVLRFLLFSIAVFLTAVAGFTAFLKRVSAPAAAFVGLLSIQPILNAIIAVVTGRSPNYLAAAVGGIVASIMWWFWYQEDTPSAPRT